MTGLSPSRCCFSAASSVCVTWESVGGRELSVGSQVMPVVCPCCHHSLTCRDPGQVNPPFQMSHCSGNNRGADLQTGHRGRGCVSVDAPRLGTCLAANTHHPTFSSVTPLPRIPQPPFLSRPWASNRDALQTPFYSALPPSDSGGSLPHPHPPFGPGQFIFVAWSVNGSLQNTSASYRRTAGPLTTTPPL